MTRRRRHLTASDLEWERRWQELGYPAQEREYYEQTRQHAQFVLSCSMLHRKGVVGVSDVAIGPYGRKSVWHCDDAD